MALLIIAFLAGAATGLIFSAWALVPVTAIGMIAAFSAEFALGTGLGPSAASGGFAMIVLDLGYGFALILRNFEGFARVGSGTKPHPYNRM